MVSNQDKYVPSFTTVDQVNATDHPDRKEVLSTVVYQGDQLFEERARNVQWTICVGNRTYKTNVAKGVHKAYNEYIRSFMIEKLKHIFVLLSWK